MRKLILILSALTLPTSTTAQPASRFSRFSTAAPFTCNAMVRGEVYVNTTDSKPYHCNGSAWTAMEGGGGGAPSTATYITQTPDAGLSAEQALSLLGTGLTISTTGTGVISIYGGTSCTNQFPRSLNASGAATCASVATADVADNAIDNTKLRDSAGFSVIGKATAGASDPADIVAADETVLGRTGGGNLGFAQVATGQVAADAITYAKIQNTSAASKLLGRGSAAGAGDPEEITLGTNLSMSGTTLNASGGGAGNFAEVEVDFGVTGNTTASVVVTGQAWVGASSTIICSPTMFSTADRDDGDEDALIEGLTVAVHTRVAATGFTLMAHPENGVAYGKFKVHCTGG